MEVNTIDNTIKIITKPVTAPKKEGRGLVIENLPASSMFKEIIDEVGKDVFTYLEKFRITTNSNILFLSYTRHYLYDADQLKKVDTLINFKSLNRVPHLWYHLFTMNRILPVNGHFIGCFVDYATQRERMIKNKHSLLGQLFLYAYRIVNRVFPRIPLLNGIQHWANQGKTKCMTRNEANILLEKSGFKVVDMTEIDGVTYFITLKIDHANERSVSLWNLLNYFKTKSHVINI